MDGPASSPVDEPSFSTAHRHAVAIGGLLYLVVSVVVWWNVWAHPSSTTTCACGDPGLFMWFLAWPAHAMANGLDPLHSSAVFPPEGMNLLANTGVLAVGVVLAPVTWLFGPVTTLNVAMTASPVLSAMAMFVLLRRWVGWSPAAWFGGLLYGFSPFALTNLAAGHIMLGLQVVPPLIVLCLDELLVRQSRRPVATGVALGILIGVQFFIGTEMLVITSIGVIVGLALFVIHAAWNDRARLRQRAHVAAVGLLAGALTAIVLLAYPLWYALDGPAHLSGPIWPGLDLSSEVTLLKDYVVPPSANISSLFGSSLNHLTGGYQGPVLSAQFLGIGAVIVALVGLVVWRGDRRLWLFAAVGITSVVLSRGAFSAEAKSLPLLQDIVPQRIVSVTVFAAAVMLGLVVDHTYQAVEGWRSQVRPAAPTAHGRPRGLRHGPGILAGLGVAAVALVAPAAYLSQTVPMTAVPAVVPAWFRDVAPHLPGHQVLLVFPAPFAIETALAWQAQNGDGYTLVGGSGPGSVPTRAGRERQGQEFLSTASFALTPTSHMTTGSDITAVRRALDGWGVTMVVLPDQANLPAYDQVLSVTSTAALVTAATGTRPHHQSDAWVWADVDHGPPERHLSTAQFTRCIAFLPSRGTAAVDNASSCVLSTVV